MEKFKAIRVNENEIVLESATELDRLFETIKNEENIIINWIEGKKTTSRIMVSEGLITKIKDGSLTLTAEEEGGK